MIISHCRLESRPMSLWCIHFCSIRNLVLDIVDVIVIQLCKVFNPRERLLVESVKHRTLKTINLVSPMDENGLIHGPRCSRRRHVTLGRTEVRLLISWTVNSDRNITVKDDVEAWILLYLCLNTGCNLGCLQGWSDGLDRWMTFTMSYHSRCRFRLKIISILVCCVGLHTQREFPGSGHSITRYSKV
jgi:hypothetical protein